MKKRIISAIIALLLCVPIVLKGGIIFQLLAIVVSFLGFLEISDLITKNKLYKSVALISFFAIILSNINKVDFINILDYRIMGITLLMFMIMKLVYHKDKDYDIVNCFSLFGITMMLSFAFSIMIIIRNIDLYYFLYLFIITIMTDTFAYIVGKLIGKHKLKKISPNKTYEGCIGGSFFGTIVSCIFYLVFINSGVNIFILVTITLFLTVIGQLGDLFFSLIKRNFKIKDFSNIMPGHGGILDRLDSIIFVMIAITYFINFI